ncbi:hypothetical protein BRAS3843_1640018 [Bradyrhizobium sp. STM 3843]|nr:hypothetical protein BRAS3843_1640018 [Bradyrhizobium sp. STM 3843]
MRRSARRVPFAPKPQAPIDARDLPTPEQITLCGSVTNQPAMTKNYGRALVGDGNTFSTPVTATSRFSEPSSKQRTSLASSRDQELPSP